MKTELPDKKRLLHTLAKRLDAITLLQLFPGYDPQGLREMLSSMADAIEDAQSTTNTNTKTSEIVTDGSCCLYTDGASRGNPGEAGAGAVLLDANGLERAARAVYLGICTNNVAEYKALLIGLAEARLQGCQELTICLDSELIVRQILGEYKVRNESLLQLFQQVRVQLGHFKQWSIMHVPRAQNARADALANQGIDEHMAHAPLATEL